MTSVDDPHPSRPADASAPAVPRAPGTHAPYDLERRPGQWRGRMLGLVVILVVAAGIVVLVLWRLAHAHADQQAAFGHRRGGGGGWGGMTTPVVTATAVAKDIPITVQALGTVTPIATVTIHTQIAGVLQRIGFQEGQVVHEGDFIAQIDDRPYRYALAQASGQLERDQALLHDAQQDLERYAKLITSESISHQTYDAQVALVAQDRGNCAADQAQMDTAKLNIGYCHLVAPVTGRLGIRQVDPGNYVTPGDANGLVVITQMDPMSVIFTVPEDQLPAILRRTTHGATLTVTAYDRNEGTTLAQGTLVAIDNIIDTATGTVKMRAQFDNHDNLLFPSQFVNIEVLVRSLADAVTIPAAAVQQGAPGIFVYVITEGTGEDGKPAHLAHIRVVEPGPTANEMTAIVNGLKIGEVVVVQGADRLKDGATVTLSPANPTPPGGGTTSHHHWHGSGMGTSGAKEPGGSAAGSGAPATHASGSDGATVNGTTPTGGWQGHHHRHRTGSENGSGQASAPETPVGQPAGQPASPARPRASGSQQQ